MNDKTQTCASGMKQTLQIFYETLTLCKKPVKVKAFFGLKKKSMLNSLNIAQYQITEEAVLTYLVL